MQVPAGIAQLGTVGCCSRHLAEGVVAASLAVCYRKEIEDLCCQISYFSIKKIFFKVRPSSFIAACLPPQEINVNYRTLVEPQVLGSTSPEPHTPHRLTHLISEGERCPEEP